MKKKQKFTLSNSKIILLTSLILVVGVIMLFFSIFFAPSQSPNETVLETIVEETKETQKEEIAKIESTKSDLKTSNSTEKLNTEKKTSTTTKETPKTEVPKTPEVTKTEEKTKTVTTKTTETEKSKTEDTKNTTQPAKSETQKSETTVKPTKNGKLVFVFDDAGHNMTQLKPFLSMPFPITVAILPKLAYSKEAAVALRNAGVCSILHQPMQAVNLSVDPGPGAIKPEMYSYEIEEIVKENLAEVGPVIGLNNHEGSLITASQSDIGTVLDVCKEKGIIFLDSRTNSESKARQAALERGMTILERDIFLDNIQEKSEIISMVNKGLEIADKKGYVIMIGHVWCKDLAKILSDMYPNLKAQGYNFLSLQELYNELN